MATKDQWRYAVHAVPMGTDLSSSNAEQYLVMNGVWGTRNQAATEGVAVASAMASQREGIYKGIPYPRTKLQDMAKSMASYESDGFSFGVEHTQERIYVSIEIN